MEKHEETRYVSELKDYSMSLNYNLFKKLNETAYRYRSGKEVWYSK
jgi:hypothetical protein